MPAMPPPARLGTSREAHKVPCVIGHGTLLNRQYVVPDLKGHSS